MQDAKRISPEELHELLDRGEVTILDMRQGEAWSKASTKIPGAIRVHPDAFKEYKAALPEGRRVVTYCT